MPDRRRSFLLPSVFLCLLAGVFLFLSYRVSGTGLDSLRKFFAPVHTSVSWSILQEIKDLEELETAAYDMRIVFPFDLVGEDEVDWRFLKIQYDRSPSQFLQKTSSDWYVGGILPREWKYGNLYYLCRQAGIDPGRPDNRFIVMSISIHAGVKLNSWLSGFETSGPEDIVKGIEISIADDGSRSLMILAPQVEVTSFIVEDRDVTKEEYPDVPVSPEEWSHLVSGLEPALREMAMSGKLLERADSEARSFLTEIFKAAGYDNVVFIEI